MDHVVIPIGRDHVKAIDLLVHGAARAAKMDLSRVESLPHVTLVAYSGLPRTVALHHLQAFVMTVHPFRSTRYGFFTGENAPT